MVTGKPVFDPLHTKLSLPFFFFFQNTTAAVSFFFPCGQLNKKKHPSYKRRIVGEITDLQNQVFSQDTTHDFLIEP